jgi:glycosyltransferase involved in cell wall biosynthesis
MLQNFIRKVLSKIRASGADNHWQKWLENEEKQRTHYRQEMAWSIQSMTHRPLISVILPVYNTDERLLRECIDSVLQQSYPNWQLCIADDYSSIPHVRSVLKGYEATDSRVKVVFRKTNGHISAASNSALELTSGEFAALLDHDDILSEDALYRVALELNHYPNVDVIYSDEDKIDMAGRRYDPTFKPDFSRDLFYSLNMLNHLTVFRIKILKDVGGFREGFEGSQDHDLGLRVLEKIPESNIRHIPRILYHWRSSPGSVAGDSNEKSYAQVQARLAIGEHLTRMGCRATVTAGPNNWHKVNYELPETKPKIKVFIWRDDQSEGSRPSDLPQNTSYPDCTFVEIGPDRGLAELLNASARDSDAELLCFVRSNIKSVAMRWLEELAAFAIQKGIGAVGAKVIDEDGLVIDGPLIIGAAGLVDVAHRGFGSDEPGNMGRNVVNGNFSALSAICLMTSRTAFDSVGGFDEQFGHTLFDADYCLRLLEKDMRIVILPHVILRLTEGNPAERRAGTGSLEHELFRSRWQKYFERDPFYNPNFSHDNARFVIGSPAETKAHR